jgi:hypothetical protein
MNASLNAARHVPPPPATLHEIETLGRELAAAGYCEHRDPLTTRVAADLARFATQVYELHAALVAARLRAANLEAAIRAALGAHHDGEPDPFAYLRDELPASAGGDAYGA